MAIYVDRFLKGPKSEDVSDDYTSMILPLFVDHLEQSPEAQILDIGPVCGNNISFFTQHSKKLYICDMFQNLDKIYRQGRPINPLWKHLNYPPQTFDGIQLWNLADHLEDRHLAKLVELCLTLLKPGGLLMLFAQNEPPPASPVTAFVIKNNFKLSLRPQPHLSLPYNYRHNRDVIAKMAPFTMIKSCIYRTGNREFLFRRDQNLS